MFNPHHNLTADGVEIVAGLRVITNDLTHGVVVDDKDDTEYRCCNGIHAGQHSGGQRTGQMRVNGGWFTDHDAKAKLNCDKYCGHDHWFNVRIDGRDTASGTWNGERLATMFDGRKA